MGCNLCFSIISIHAPTRGATYQQVHFTVAYIIFQSTLPREERPATPIIVLRNSYISIHAPTRGATTDQRRHRDSNTFQSTLPREERPADSCQTHYCQHFNPRSHERSDQKKDQLYGSYKISIHAPTRGATEYVEKHKTIDNISIHAPTRGATWSPV